MKTVSEEEETSLFTIEKISPVVTPSVSTLSGCALCQHCSLLRLLAQSHHVGAEHVPIYPYDNSTKRGGCAYPGQAQGTAPTEVVV